ncbi:ubiquitin carboxyl-terminal hydrolase 20-like isoform X2 [Watersipora subatra]|uniref:ubiquitin carboxyl-terminal hydrolase 20-like isoform X2 n=1 Tax=Watersipora subatra TaxID=2589382 RepID=UPI00355C594D
MPGRRKKTSSCPHVTNCHHSLSWNFILSKRESLCHTCSHPSKDIWLCATCLSCHGDHGDTDHGDKDHSIKHVQECDHQLAVNTKTGRFWCHSCGGEVYQGRDNYPEFRLPKQQMMHVDWDTIAGTSMFGSALKPRGRTGLRNLGNTCYMNSALQCLSNCPAMTLYFLTLVDSHISDPRKAKLAGAYKYLIKDTQELLRCLIDQLHEELKREITYDPPYHTTIDPNQSEQRSILYSSIIADIFNGLIKSSVRCLHCDKVSVTKEAFQDLSLPIPSGDQLSKLHNKSKEVVQPASPPVDTNQGLLSWLLLSSLSYIWNFASKWNWLSSETVTLEDCLSALFSVDDLKGDNMYSCDNCKMLRNGKKEVSIVSLPEVLCIHLKRFRHDVLHSSKITTHVSFPLEGLDLSPYIKKDTEPYCDGRYRLTGVICHLGSFAGGHYKAYARHPANQAWYEYDDQYVCEVSSQVVKGCEAYVLFYSKDASMCVSFRNQLLAQLQVSQNDHLLQFYISKLWLLKFFSLVDPGPISNCSDFLCVHGFVRPTEYSMVYERVVALSAENWESLYIRYGGGPPVNSLTKCATCQANIDENTRRQRQEYDTYRMLYNRTANHIYAVDARWLMRWERYATGQVSIPPGPIDNKSIAAQKAVDIRRGRQQYSYSVNGPTWRFLKETYGGGPEAIISSGRNPESDDESSTISKKTVSPEEDGAISSTSITVSQSDASLCTQSTTSVKQPCKSQSAPHIALPEQVAVLKESMST